MNIIEQFPIGEIIVPLDFIETVPNHNKIVDKEALYLLTGELPPIVITPNKVLTDGYINYLLAIKYKLTEASVSMKPLCLIKAKHKKLGKDYLWIVPSEMEGAISIGDRVAVSTAAGVRFVIVEDIAFTEEIPFEEQLRRVLFLCRKAGGRHNGDED